MTEPKPEWTVGQRRLHFVIEGKFKPYTRMTQRGKWVSPDAQDYLTSQDALRLQFRTQMRGRAMLPGQAPLALSVSLSFADHRRDLSNELKAIEDAMQGIVFPDDRWIDQINILRADGGHADVAVVDVEML